MIVLPTRLESHRASRPLRGRHLWRKALIGTLIAGVLGGPFASGGRAAPRGVPSCSVAGQITPHGGWYSIKGPAFPTGQQVIWDYAVHPKQPEQIFVTNGAAVMRSLDSGCHWSLAYSLGEGGIGVGVATARILEIEVAAPGVLYLPIQEMDPVPKPHVVVSQNAGETWSSSDSGLLESVFGRIRDLDASLTDGDAAGLLVDVELTEPGVVSIEGEQSLFVTNNAGATWELRHSFDDGTEASAGGLSISINASGELSQLAMNPVRSNEIWIYGEPGVLYSDGVNVDEVGIGKPELLDIGYDGGSVVAYEQSATQGQLSVNGGRSFETLDTGIPVDAIDLVQGQAPFFSVLGSLGRVFIQADTPFGSRQLFDASPSDGRGISDPQVARVEGQVLPAIFGRTSNTIEVTYEPRRRRIKPNEVTASLVEPPDLVGDNRLVPTSKRVEMRAGQDKTIPYRLALPAASTPLDVYFMIDISGSMQGTINGIRSAMQEIVDRLAQLKIDVAFGVGSFRSYNDPPAYDRVRDIGPAGAEVAAALNSLEARGGGQETQMAALLESATGEGRNGIPPNRNMNFRPGSLRVAIEVTDEPISDGGAHPSYQTVIGGLREHDVKMVGLAIQEGGGLLGEDDYDNPGPPADILQLVASGSGATAPVGGVDCDGDGDAEIAEDGPMVCLIPPDEAEEASLMADAIVNVLEAVQDIQDLDVTVTSSVDAESSSEVVEAIEPEMFPAVDLKEPSRHAFDLTIACPEVAKRTTYPLRVAVNRRGGPLGTADLTLVCDPRPGPKKDRVLPFLTAFTPVAAVLPPPPRPPDPVPEPNPNPQPNPQQNPQGQAGFAAQEQQQPQVALAHGNPPEATEQIATEDHFMTARRESRVPPVGFVFAAGAITSLFAYMAARTTVRTQGAHGRRRRRRPNESHFAAGRLRRLSGRRN